MNLFRFRFTLCLDNDVREQRANKCWAIYRFLSSAITPVPKLNNSHILSVFICFLPVTVCRCSRVLLSKNTLFHSVYTECRGIRKTRLMARVAVGDVSECKILYSKFRDRFA